MSGILACAAGLLPLGRCILNLLPLGCGEELRLSELWSLAAARL